MLKKTITIDANWALRRMPPSTHPGGQCELPQSSITLTPVPDQEVVLSRLLDVVSKTSLRRSGFGASAVWEKGWTQVLERVQERGFSFDTLAPQYFQGQFTFRVDREFYYSDIPNSAYFLDLIVRDQFLRSCLSNHGRIVELGAGTGLNLLLLEQIWPGREILLTDWVKPSIDLAILAEQVVDLEVSAAQFNITTLDGWERLEVGPGDTILTTQSLEQVGPFHKPLINFLIQAKPSKCVHMEPIKEVYDPTQPVDATAIAYHEKRGYLDGFASYIGNLRDRGLVSEFNVTRLRYGNQFHEAYTIVEWTPA